MSDPETPVPRPRPRPQGSLAGIALGALLIVAGGAWLLDTLDVVDISFDVLLPAALVVVGVVLIASARRGRQGGLIAVGVVLTVLSAAASAGDVGGGVGRRRIEVTGAERARDQRLGVGQLVVDLSGIAPAGPTEISAEVGIGELRVELPEDLPVRVHAESGIGQVEVLGEQDGGFGSELDHTDQGFDSAATSLDIELSVGLGEVTVVR